MADTTKHPKPPSVHDLRIPATPEELAKAVLRPPKKPHT